jgi:ubiquinol-cytochrome c reductase iron-sulfur subunit
VTEQHELPAHAEAPAASGGIAVVAEHPVENPGFRPERPRVTDLDPKVEKSQERRIVALFFVSIIGSVAAVALYILFPIIPGDMQSVRNNTMFVGTAIALALLAIGVGVVHWSKALMHGHDLVEERHATRGSEPTRERVVEIFKEANAESGFTRRRLLRNTLITAAAVSPLPAIVLLRDLAPSADPVPLLKHTMWEAGMRLTRDPSGTPIRAADVTLGSAFHVIPEGLNELPHGRLEAKAKAAVLLMRLKPEDLHGTDGGPIPEDRADWSFRGIVAYSKICTHVGCPVALYEQQTHHLLCPCHQSQFDITREARVIFGPAKRPLPQLPITVDDEGYLIARSDFTEPVGPSFWERAL